MRLVGPVFFKELITLSRRWRHFAVRALFLGAIVLAVCSQLPSRQFVSSYRGGFRDYAAEVGWPLFCAVIQFQFWAIVVIVPALVAGVVASEKEHDTFGLLLLTQQSLLRVLLDKLLSRLAYVSLLMLAGLPLMLALLKFGGVKTESIAAAYLALLATVAYAAGVGLLCSVWAHTVSGAVLLAFVLLPLAGGGAGWAYRSATGPGLLTNYAAYTMLSISPYAVLDSLLQRHGPDGYWRGAAPGWSPVDAGLISVLGGGLFLLAAVCVSWWLLPHRLTRRPQSLLKRLFLALDRRCRQLRGIWGKEVLKDRPLGRHPVWWRETSKRFTASNGFLIRSGCVLFGLLVFLMACFVEYDERIVGEILSLWMGLVVVAAAVSAARAFSAEKERQTWPVLLSTPVSARAIYLGKLAGSMKSLSAMLLAPFGVAVATLVWHNWQGGGALFLLAALALLVVAHVVVTGLNASLRRRRTLTALLQTALSLAAQGVVCYLVLVEVGRGLRNEMLSESMDLLVRFWLELPGRLVRRLVYTVADLPGIEDFIDDVLSSLHYAGPGGSLLPLAAVAQLLLLLLLVRVYLAIGSFDRVVGRY